MKVSKISASLALAVVMALGSGCDRYLDVNTDPINPIDAQVQLLLPTVQGAMSTSLGHSVLGLSQPSAAITQQLVNARVGSYFLDGTSFNNQWTGLYLMLQNNEQIIQRGTASSAWAFVGIAQIQKAYAFSQMVDVWGDLPYSEALQGINNLAPKFDDDEAIYTDLFRLIDAGIANMQRTDGTRTPSPTEDLIYGGNSTRWIRLANSLKLKLYNQIRLTRSVANEVTPLLNSTPSPLLASTADDFEFRYGTNAGTPENRHPGFQGDYAQSGRENNINPYFFQLMTTNSDPRIPYYFYNQVATTAPVQADFQLGRFVTTRFGSIGQQASANTANIRTLQGLYPVGGRYDNGMGGAANANSARGNVAQRFITLFAQQFTVAELQLTVLNNAAAARTAFNAGLTEAFAKVNQVAANDGSPVIPAAAVMSYITAALARYDAAATTEAKLNVVMTEKYVANFGTGTDVYTDYRRTGYPNIPNADTDGDQLTVATGAFPLRFPYRNDDLLSNPNAPQQPNITTDRIFWDR